MRSVSLPTFAVLCSVFCGCNQQPPNRAVSEAPRPAPPVALHLGQTVTVSGGAGEGWPCASSLGALQELMKWHKATMEKREVE